MKVQALAGLRRNMLARLVLRVARLLPEDSGGNQRDQDFVVTAHPR